MVWAAHSRFCTPSAQHLRALPPAQPLTHKGEVTPESRHLAAIPGCVAAAEPGVGCDLLHKVLAIPTRLVGTAVSAIGRGQVNGQDQLGLGLVQVGGAARHREGGCGWGAGLGSKSHIPVVSCSDGASVDSGDSGGTCGICREVGATCEHGLSA